jgi:hypothetical protein
MEPKTVLDNLYAGRPQAHLANDPLLPLPSISEDREIGG